MRILDDARAVAVVDFEPVVVSGTLGAEQMAADPGERGARTGRGDRFAVDQTGQQYVYPAAAGTEHAIRCRMRSGEESVDPVAHQLDASRASAATTAFGSRVFQNGGRPAIR
ncbi:hypothetical protein ACFOJ6_19595 [Gordonia humi]|uniref:hypothetical protein n=1 Tax=Gordonia humi TaxID=686429 RepID=UPI0036176155